MLLTKFDINYYLTEKPPAFWIAGLLISGLLAVLVFVLMRRLISWAVAGATLSALVSAAIAGLGRCVVPLVRDSLGVLIVVLGTMVMLWVVANLIVTLVNASTFALLIVRLYDRMGMSRDEMPSRLDASNRPPGAINGWTISRKMVLNPPNAARSELWTIEALARQLPGPESNSCTGDQS